MHHFWRVAFVVEQDVLFDPVQVRFIRPISVLLHTQPIDDLLKEAFISGSMNHCSIHKHNMSGI
jgi:hypothetical protein